MQEQSIFIEALERSDPVERAAFLDRVCANAPALRQRIERLLQRHQSGDGFLEPPGALLAATVDEPISESPGTVIGPYKLLEQLGEGGFGVVFMAEQSRPVRRKVALKVLKPGMDTRQVVARFEAERQALALMDHPHIARVFDGGATPSGRPYFVMELVKGVPITDFCDRQQLTPRQRLELFIPLCQAVQHAHQKGIIHRDLKPSNVLVTMHDTTPVVKVIDFGVAKALTQALTDKTLFTGFAQMIGTPLYISPEQAGQSGLDIDTRTDIYALGVILYELLTGTTPFEKERLKELSYDELRRIIREEEPARPSTRLSTLDRQAARTIAAQRGTDVQRLSRLMRDELDWIVLKALEKDRNRRYESASAFAADVQRYLVDEPVQACPPSAAYRLRKFVRRNKVALAITGLVLLVLLTLTGGIGMYLRERAKHLADREREKTRQQAIHEVKIKAGEHANRGYAFLQQDKLDQSIAEYRKAIELDPQFAAAHRNLGLALRRQGKVEEAIAEYRKAIELNPQDGLAHGYLGLILASQAKQDYRGAEVFLRKAIALRPKDSQTHWVLGLAIANQGRLDEGIAFFRKAIELDPMKDQPYFFTYVFLMKKGKVEEAVAFICKAAATNPILIAYLNDFAWNLATAADPKSRNPKVAIELAERAVKLSPREVGYWNTLGVARYRRGNWEEAIEALNKSVDLRKGGDSFDWFFLAMAHGQLGHKDKAQQHFQQTVQWMEQDQKRLQNAELQRFRAEAEKLLKIDERGTPKKQDGFDTVRGEEGTSGRRVARDARHAVKVGVFAGEGGEAMKLHEGNNQSIIRQQFILLAEDRSRLHQGLGERQDLNKQMGQVCDRLAKDSELGDLGMVLAQAHGKARRWPASPLHGFESHQPIGEIRQHVSRRETADLLQLDALDQLRTSRPILGIAREMIDQHVGIEEDRLACRDVGEVHGDSKMPNSGAVAMRRRISGSPVHISIPAVRSAQVSSESTVRRTVSCSLNGNGWLGLSTPFS